MRRCLAASAAAVAALAICVAVAGPAFGAADTEHITETILIPPGTTVDDTCAGAGVVGVVSGTETIDGRLVTTPTGGASFSGTDTFVFRADFPDRSYLLGSQSGPLSATSTDRVLTFGSTVHERSTLFDANGSILALEQFHARNRTTIVDGRATADFDNGFVTCR